MRTLLLSFALLLVGGLLAQPDSTWVRYQSGYVFKDGLYRDFQAFRNNAPSVPKAQLRTVQGQPVTDLRNTNGKLVVPDSTAEGQRIDLYDLWGFCDNGVVYIRAGNGFSRIGMMGSISHLTFDATYRDVRPYTYGGGMNYTVEEQRFLDLTTGGFLPINAGGIREVLQRDPILLEEFDALPKKQRNKDETVFLFMRRYNDRHPLYFPR